MNHREASEKESRTYEKLLIESGQEETYIELKWEQWR